MIFIDVQKCRIQNYSAPSSVLTGSLAAALGAGILVLATGTGRPAFTFTGVATGGLDDAEATNAASFSFFDFFLSLSSSFFPLTLAFFYASLTALAWAFIASFSNLATFFASLVAAFSMDFFIFFDPAAIDSIFPDNVSAISDDNFFVADFILSYLTSRFE